MIEENEEEKEIIKPNKVAFLEYFTKFEEDRLRLRRNLLKKIVRRIQDNEM